MASLALASLLLAGATACSGDGAQAEPTPKMPPISSSTPSTPEPEPWEVKSRAGVKAFLQRYVEIFSEATRTGDTEAYRALSTNCDGCDEVADQVDEVYQAGGRIESEPDKFKGWSVDENGLNGGAACVLVFESSRTRWIRRPGAEPETYPGGTIEQLVKLEWTGSGWTVTGLFPLES